MNFYSKSRRSGRLENEVSDSGYSQLTQSDEANNESFMLFRHDITQLQLNLSTK